MTAVSARPCRPGSAARSTSRPACRSDSLGIEQSSGLFYVRLRCAVHLAACMPLGFARHRTVLRTVLCPAPLRGPPRGLHAARIR
ncbi:hypothetical protein ACFOEY_16400 [Paracandidimonas soli]|uniref:hypothetical protein n=1 Tax=Paracandidimonas soli TaxID=1917182 RepID=UPI00360728E3